MAKVFSGLNAPRESQCDTPRESLRDRLSPPEQLTADVRSHLISPRTFSRWSHTGRALAPP
ncbi:hypothetical protein [Nodosilinea sp. P-1105]|uniref:hypothetical protein n=1 Tax=Nodosilinea sp. P-1105 TaxID=2546229 RepID=UPI00146B23CE|nr:hypothetical protein [Nodosilinea sp. P-1105]NMF84637.1 hypothetical protein [Nodosilinea sp. P-1105]